MLRRLFFSSFFIFIFRSLLPALSLATLLLGAPFEKRPQKIRRVFSGPPSSNPIDSRFPIQLTHPRRNFEKPANTRLNFKLQNFRFLRKNERSWKKWLLIYIYICSNHRYFIRNYNLEKGNEKVTKLNQVKGKPCKRQIFPKKKILFYRNSNWKIFPLFHWLVQNEFNWFWLIEID